MANSAQLGKLWVGMELETGQFDTQVRETESRLDRLAKRFGITADRAKAAGAAIGVAMGAGLASIALGITKAVNQADQLDELAQQLGTTAEALSKMAYAAQISGTPIEAFSTAVKRMAANMEVFASGDTQSAAGRTLSAMGISATDATGKIKDMDTLILELSDHFHRYKNTIGETALAQSLFGESGATMLPFLNAGREGINKLREEADRLGITLSNESAKAAGDMKAAMERLSISGDTMYRQIAERITPALNVLTESLIQNGQKYGDVKTGTELVSDAIYYLGKAVIYVDGLIRKYSILLSGYADQLGKIAGMDFEGAAKSFSDMTAKIEAEAARSSVVMDEYYQKGTPVKPFAGQQSNAAGKRDKGDFGPETEPVEGGQEPPIVKSIKAITEAKTAQTEALQRANEAWAKGTQLTEEVMTPLEAYHLALEKTDKLLRSNSISAETAARAQQKAALVASNAYANMAGNIASDLGKVFENNKAVAIATALINTYQAVTNAWASVPYPLNIAAAAASLAAGLAQVANIKSTSKNSTSGSSSSGSGAVAGGGETGGGSAGSTLSVQGISSDSLFSGDMVRNLAGKLLEFQRDGGRVVLI